MALYRACGNVMSVAVANGYSIRAFVAASRAELRAGTGTIASPRRPLMRQSSTKPTSEPSNNNEPPNLGTAGVNAESDHAKETSSTSPWYFQVPADTNGSFSSSYNRHDIIPTVAFAPPLFNPLFTYLSIDLGLDDISVLDLRSLDPPAALGANLLMLFGTARSEKHLHVSADRLCRWLRTEHQLSPFADGLLGRNELKLRMKRKAKRARLLNSVGVKSTRGQEGEEVRTGWVCVNLGLVEEHELSAPEVGNQTADKDFIGFQSEGKGCRLVVQMMTDEKRGQLDLESLWAGIKNRTAAVE